MKTRKIFEKNGLTFIDLFAGIGGTRRAFEDVGCECVYSSEWDEYAQKTYEANYGEKPDGDITKVKVTHIPKHNILVGGFPCQPFSISGVSKKNALGRPHGFDDPTQGTLFFDIKRILKNRKPRAFLLENVKNLESHDKGKTFQVIMRTLQEELGYHVRYMVIDADAYVPQHRERIYIVGFSGKKYAEAFRFPIYRPDKKPQFRDILQERVDARYTLSDKLWNYLVEYAEKHRARGNGFGFGLTKLDGRARTLSARYYKDGSEILIPQKGKNPRRLTPEECSLLMGFDDDFVIPVSDTRAYKQFGNSVVVPVVYDIARSMVGTLLGTDLFSQGEKSYYRFVSGKRYEQESLNLR